MAEITTTTNVSNNASTPARTEEHGDDTSPMTEIRNQEFRGARVVGISVDTLKSYYEEHNSETFEDRFQGNDETIAAYSKKNELKIKQWLRSSRKQPPHVETEEEKKQKEKIERMKRNFCAETALLTCLRDPGNADWHRTTFECPARPGATFESPFAVMSEDFNSLSEEEKLQFATRKMQKDLPTTGIRSTTRTAPDIDNLFRKEGLAGQPRIMFNAHKMVLNALDKIDDGDLNTSVIKLICELYDACMLGTVRTTMDEEEKFQSTNLLKTVGWFFNSLVAHMEIGRQMEFEPLICKPEKKLTDEERENKEDDKEALESELRSIQIRLRKAERNLDEKKIKSLTDKIERKKDDISKLEAALRQTDADLPENESCVNYDLKKGFNDVKNYEYVETPLGTETRSKSPIPSVVAVRAASRFASIAKAGDKRNRNDDADGSSSDGGSSSKKSKTDDE
jgi:hypothetical protein